MKFWLGLLGSQLVVIIVAAVIVLAIRLRPPTFPVAPVPVGPALQQLGVGRWDDPDGTARCYGVRDGDRLVGVSCFPSVPQVIAQEWVP